MKESMIVMWASVLLENLKGFLGLGMDLITGLTKAETRSMVSKRMGENESPTLSPLEGWTVARYSMVKKLFWAGDRGGESDL